MRHLAHSGDRCASRLEAIVPGMIERALTAGVTPLSVSINALVARIAVCERGQGANDEVTTLKAGIVELRKDVDQLQCTNMSMIFGTVEIADMPAETDVPAATTGYEVRVKEVAAAESEAEID
ncbi:hypothetical protein H5410_015134 [Solanum commersonii]|uniref:Polyprotein protein n=1 Tax=Solanum commersonii TaxID=4109 RepID=A0A9J5ZSV5_SOLCO|nr:hypothetical protein H5410_015134 [Solanum commersonii]